MLCSPRPRPSRRVVFIPLTAIAFALCLCAFAPGAHAQQLSIPGLQSPVKEEPSARQAVPVEVRAALGRAPLGRLYDYLKAAPAKVRRLSALTTREIREERPEEKKLRVGTVRAFPRPIKVASDSTLYNLAEGDVRVMELVSEGALYTRVHFQGMQLPAGARIFVYSAKNVDDFYGPYEGRGDSEDGTFWTPPVEGDRVVIEYFTPHGTASANDIPFQVSEVSHIYRSLFAGTDDAAGACNLDVTSDWSEVAKSVGYLEFTSGADEYACTGTLLNNQSNDLTPYLLTANHCFDTQTEAQTLRVYWNYNSGNTPPAGTPHTDGANLLRTGAASDFTLVRLTGTLPTGLFFSGWDATPTPVSTSVTGIHHPEGSYKRISFGSTIADCGVGLPGPCQNFTNIRWNSGTTEAGSSGSGIWKGTPSDPKLVGTLTGGFASCSSPSGTDYYGSFSITYPYISSFLQRGDNGPDDILEENDTRSAARPIEAGVYNNLVVKGSDEDWYKVSVVAGGAVAFKIDLTHSNGDIYIQLFRGSEASPTETSQDPFSDSERVISINQTGATADYYLRVFTPGLQNNYTLTVAGAGSVCAPAPINYGQTVSGTLSTSDCTSAFRVPNFSGIFYSDRYYFTAQKGQQITVTLSATSSFNTYMIMQGIVGQMVYTDTPTSGKPGSLFNLTAPETGTYTIEVSSYDPGVTGTYTLSLSEAPDTLTIAAGGFNVREDEGRVAIIVNRSPNASGPASVNYATSDFSGLNECSKVTLSASSRCDYASSVGTLRFAPGETSKTVYIPLVNDSFAEGTETFLFNLSNLTGATYGPHQTATVSIFDDDSATGANPIVGVPFFVRQQYIDFLGREPDAGGFAAWQNILNTCKAGDTSCDRISVSSGFFRSPEFQDRGSFVFRFYAATLGRNPFYAEFMPDLAKVSGFLSDEQLEANKVAFVQEFMTRSEFVNRYGSLSNAAFVDTLVQTAGLSGHPLRDAWVGLLNSNGATRAQVVRAFTESVEVYNKFYNQAFVVMQYFGYLRRDPDGSYTTWINILNQTGDFRGMISGFMNSNEYVLRFGP